MNKVEEIIAATKLGELMHKKEEEARKKNTVWIVLTAIAAVAAAAGIAYALYKHFSPKYMDDFEEDFDDDFEDFDDDFFEDENA